MKKGPHVRWVPWLMDARGNQSVKLDLGPGFAVFETPEEITQFFANMPKTHPQLVGKHIEFIEVRGNESERARQS